MVGDLATDLVNVSVCPGMYQIKFEDIHFSSVFYDCHCASNFYAHVPCGYGIIISCVPL